ncbi:MAG: AAA family ATPase, partial [Deltaproteobacteria bacterium]|nr:AAA family ATPase [Deltaproteobacteria bacterium]
MAWELNGIQIDVVEFPNGLGAKEFNEKTFTGPIQKQLRDALSYLKTNIIKSKVIKYDDTEKADKVYNYPYPAIEEALANAVYHRNYELRDPIEVRVLPSSI